MPTTQSFFSGLRRSIVSCAAVALLASSTAVAQVTDIINNPSVVNTDWWWVHQRGYTLSSDATGNTFASINAIKDANPDDFGFFQTVTLSAAQQQQLAGADTFTVGGFFRGKNIVLPSNSASAATIAGFYLDVVWNNGTRSPTIIKNVQPGSFDWTFTPLVVQSNGELPQTLYLFVLTRNGVTGTLDADNIRLYKGSVTSESNKPLSLTPTTPAPTTRQPDTPGKPAPECTTDTLIAEVIGGDTIISDGQVKKIKVSLAPGAPKDRATVSLKAANGFQLSKSLLSFNGPSDPASYTVLLRSIPGSMTGRDGVVMESAITMQLDWLCSSKPFCRSKIAMKRRIRCNGNGNGMGDPHMKTMDGVYFDFQVPGYSKLFESRSLKVHIYQEKCGPIAAVGYNNAPSCYQGVAISFGQSVVRLMLDAAGNLVYSKPAGSSSALSLEKLAGNAQGYRVFLAADQSTFVDVNRNFWDPYKYFYLNVALQISPYFQDASVSGILGNWNGNPADDITKNAVLGPLVKVSNALFTCADSEVCKASTTPLGEEDLTFMTSTEVNSIPLLHKGYTPIVDSAIPVGALSPARAPPARELLSASFRGLQDSGAATTAATEETVTPSTDAPDLIDLATAQNVCGKVINSIPVCQKYVEDPVHFVDTICASDVDLLNDINIVDSSKVAYLRECRRILESSIASSLEKDANAQKELNEDRILLTFGSSSSCPNNCNGKGSCLPAGCKCDVNFSGLGCEISLLDILSQK